MASSEQIANEYYQKGMNMIRANNIELGIDNLNMAISIYEELEDSTQYVKSLRGLAIAYGIMGYDSKMLYKCLNAFDYLDKHSIRGAKHYFYATICNRYMILGDYDSAINYGKMAMQDLEDYGDSFSNKPHSFLVACLNLAYCYLQTHRFNEAETYLRRANSIAAKNDMHHHDFSLAILNSNLHHQLGDDKYVYDHLEDLAVLMKDPSITIQDYLEDLKLLIETFCSMKEFEKAEAVAKNLDSTATISSDYHMKLETSKLYMAIYKKSGDEEKYHQACVHYAEDNLAYEKAQAAEHLLEMDTSIALSIADTPLELL
ncbi:Tetratricopeptide repeat-containing protein [Pseudobutyrivibrio sp. UC1225]|uniref:tetratricopeptide repeat protein n=1 Tax=Pseudobutyrivibrio sp. UC1225 TaxID=1798185 RepID=UPI0008E933F7|nr:tetratricopeptide repeat protein [Pseudobutyrivibrio sp. UC1225]SFN68094.1 Tetratricopeptide repeat-containing protein [Pseudobutyrivibrio sp. UC1225]